MITLTLKENALTEDIQDRTHTEFLCNQAGYCWLEVK